MSKIGTTWDLSSVPGKDTLLNYIVSNYKFNSVIDVGCGKGDFFHYLNNKNIKVDGTGIDMMDEADVLYKDFKYVKSNFNDYESDEKFDLLYTSHTIEHNPDTETFLKNFFKHGKDGGLFCIIWPPPKPQVVGGHVHIFNLGIMLYNIIRTGIDCSKVKLIKVGYNLCIVGEYSYFKLQQLTYNRFEIDMLKNYFPFKAYQAFNGDTPPNTISL